MLRFCPPRPASCRGARQTPEGVRARQPRPSAAARDAGRSAGLEQRRRARAPDARRLAVLGGLGETVAVPQGRAGRRDSSLRSSAGYAGCCVLDRARSLGLRTLPASLPRDAHRTSATSTVPPNPPSPAREPGGAGSAARGRAPAAASAPGPGRGSARRRSSSAAFRSPSIASFPRALPGIASSGRGVCQEARTSVDGRHTRPARAASCRR
jgi:hypothetical protein